MSVCQSARGRRHKPAKPSHSFPLTPHNNGQWCKKIRGKLYFFGVWDNPEAALQSYLRAAADLHAGRQPHPCTLSAEGPTVKPAIYTTRERLTCTLSAEGPAVKQLCNHFLTYQHRRSQTGEIGLRWFEDCRTVLESFAGFVGPGCR